MSPRQISSCYHLRYSSCKLPFIGHKHWLSHLSWRFSVTPVSLRLLLKKSQINRKCHHINNYTRFWIWYTSHCVGCCYRNRKECNKSGHTDMAGISARICCESGCYRNRQFSGGRLIPRNKTITIMWSLIANESNCQELFLDIITCDRFSCLWVFLSISVFLQISERKILFRHDMKPTEIWTVVVR